MENFNLKKFLVENKLTTNSKILNEVQLDPENQKLKDYYIDAYLDITVDPYYDDIDAPNIGDIENHAKEYGYENTLRTIDKMEDVENARNQNLGNEDPLAKKSPGSSIDNLYMRDPMQNLTKSGKMNKLDVERLKMRIRKNLAQVTPLQEEQDDTDREMFDLQKQFLPAFEEYVRLYGIALGADIEEENPDDAATIIHRKEFLADLKVVLFKLQHGEF